jgi:hypothetical protein
MAFLAERSVVIALPGVRPLRIALDGSSGAALSVRAVKLQAIAHWRSCSGKWAAALGSERFDDGQYVLKVDERAAGSPAAWLDQEEVSLLEALAPELAGGADEVDLSLEPLRSMPSKELCVSVLRAQVSAGGFTNYVISVRCGSLEWLVSRRFREFVALHRKLIQLPAVVAWLREPLQSADLSASTAARPSTAPEASASNIPAPALSPDAVLPLPAPAPAPVPAQARRGGALASAAARARARLHALRLNLHKGTAPTTAAGAGAVAETRAERIRASGAAASSDAPPKFESESESDDSAEPRALALSLGNSFHEISLESSDSDSASGASHVELNEEEQKEGEEDPSSAAQGAQGAVRTLAQRRRSSIASAKPALVLQQKEGKKNKPAPSKRTVVGAREFPQPPSREFLTRHSTRTSVVERRVEQLGAYLKAVVKVEPLRDSPPTELLAFLGMLSVPLGASSTVGASRGRALGRLHISKLEQVAKEGDLLLFRSCSSTVASLQRHVTKSRWDHVAIVVWRKERLELLEATSDGVLTYSLRDRIAAYLSGFADVIALRRLTVERSEILVRGLRKFVQHVRGRPYGISLNKLLFASPDKQAQATDGELAAQHVDAQNEAPNAAVLTAALPRHPPPPADVEMGVDKDVNTGVEPSHEAKPLPRLDSARLVANTTQEDFFCSELVAEALIVMGLLPRTKRASNYWPVSFDQGGDVDKAIRATTGSEADVFGPPLQIDGAVLPLDSSFATFS